jgi:hypothetical protein
MLLDTYLYKKGFHKKPKNQIEFMLLDTYLYKKGFHKKIQQNISFRLFFLIYFFKARRFY